MNIDLYWTVHINDFNSFIKYLLKRYDNNFSNINELTSFNNFYASKNSSILYLAVSKEVNINGYYLSYMDHDSLSRSWYNRNEYTYMGRYYDRKDKLDRLNDIVNNS